jgi:hypothetical protein
MMVEVILGIFSLECSPILWGNCIAVVYVCDYCILREDIVRERRGSYIGCLVGCIPPFCWIIKRKDLKISLVDVSHIG